MASNIIPVGMLGVSSPPYGHETRVQRGGIGAQGACARCELFSSVAPGGPLGAAAEDAAGPEPESRPIPGHPAGHLLRRGRPPRGPVAGWGKANDSIVCQLQIKLPQNRYCHEVGGAHPELRMEVTSILPTSPGQMVESLRVVGDFSSEGLLDEIRKCPAVKSVELSGGVPGEAVFTITGPICPVVAAHRALGIPPAVPFVIEGGYKTVIIAASAEKVRQFYLRLRAHYPDVQIKSIRRSAMVGPKGILTRHQVDIFRTALYAGYWDIPRRITMTELAQMLSLSKATMSQSLATIEHKLLHEVRVDLLGTVA